MPESLPNQLDQDAQQGGLFRLRCVVDHVEHTTIEYGANLGRREVGLPVGPALPRELHQVHPCRVRFAKAIFSSQYLAEPTLVFDRRLGVESQALANAD